MNTTTTTTTAAPFGVNATNATATDTAGTTSEATPLPLLNEGVVLALGEWVGVHLGWRESASLRRE